MINLKGILVGNGVTDEVVDGNAWVPFLRGHALIDHRLNDLLINSCHGNYWNASEGSDCYNNLNQAGYLTQDLNIYGIYDDCYGLGPIKNSFNMWNRMENYMELKRKSAHVKEVREDVPCINAKRATDWINQDSVRSAVNAVSVSKKKWEICTGQINYSRITKSTIAIHRELINGGIRIFIYSGDVDMCVPNTGSELWTRELKLPIVAEWRPWKVNFQVAGYVREYKGLTYATIKGSGHTVPQYKPHQSLHFFRKFLAHQKL